MMRIDFRRTVTPRPTYAQLVVLVEQLRALAECEGCKIGRERLRQWFRSKWRRREKRARERGERFRERGTSEQVVVEVDTGLAARTGHATSDPADDQTVMDAIS